MPRSSYTGPPPAIAHMRRLGIKAVIVECDRRYCHHQVRMTFEQIKLVDETPMLEISARRRFQCCKCGSRKVRVHTDWRDHVAVGNGVSDEEA